MMREASERSADRVRWIVALMVAAVVVSVVAFAKGRGWKTWTIRRVVPTYGVHERPTVTATRPQNLDGNIPLDAFIAADVRLPNMGRVIDPQTMTANSVKLYRTRDSSVVSSRINTSGGGDAIVLQPSQPLEANTQYTFEVNPGLCDTGGTPFKAFTARFTTAADTHYANYPVAFERVELPQAAGLLATCVEIGPDHRLYVATIDGRILRFDIEPDGGLSAASPITTLQQFSHGPRLISGFCFDPASTPERPIIWVSHGELARHDAKEWTGRISRMWGPELENCQDVITHLPRSVMDHLNNQPVFGPDGAIYFGQAANTAMGAPDPEWGFRPERLLSASILRLDPTLLPAQPLDVQTEEGGTYDPFAPGAPLTIYASGVRNAYDLLWHSNGRLYAAINGSAAGGSSPATPTDPAKRPKRIDDLNGTYDMPHVAAMQNIRFTEDDTLLRVERGAYFGHPNPSRGEYVLDGGNPTAGVDPQEIPAYPVGVKPDRNWRPAAYSFGKNLAPTGAVEFKSDVFGPALKGKILVARYSGGDDVLVLSVGPDGEIDEAIAGIDGFMRLHDPLDIAEDVRTGNLYVSEFGRKCVTLLRPAQGRISDRVTRIETGPPLHSQARAN